ncbi:MAG: hypothetical protein ACO1G6_01985, partial [Bacteroidota bacterium]
GLILKNRIVLFCKTNQFNAGNNQGKLLLKTTSSALAYRVEMGLSTGMMHLSPGWVHYWCYFASFRWELPVAEEYRAFSDILFIEL